MFPINTFKLPYRSDPNQNRKRLLWLINLRWWAMAAAVVAATVALEKNWDFVSPPALALGVVFGVFFNGILDWRVRKEMHVTQELALHALADIFALTWLLAFAGGISNPLSVAYVFHVVIGALLAQQRGATAALLASVTGMILLWLLEFHAMLPVRPMTPIPVGLWWVSLLLLIGGVGYFSLVIARQLNEEHEQAVVASRRAASNLDLLLSVLDNQDVGIEMISETKESVFSNSLGSKIRTQSEGLPNAHWFCPGSKGTCRHGPQHCHERASASPANRCRFHLTLNNKDKFYEMIYLEARAKVPYDLALYVDRTDTLLFEQKNLQLEQLVTLGRTLQSFAHELNTPLMTLNTLNQDVAHTLEKSALDHEIQKDILESLSLAGSELSRCQRLTHSLLGVAELTHGQPMTYWNMTDLLERAIQLSKVGHRDTPVIFDWNAEEFNNLSIKEADLVFQILLNLFQNAVYALEHSEVETPSIKIRLRKGENHYEMIIWDNGPGLSDEIKEQLFKPFTTSKPAGEGTGLGLYASLLMAQKLVRSGIK